MNKDIIAVSPVFDKTPYYCTSYFLRRDRSKKENRGRLPVKLLSLILALNMTACALFYFKTDEGATEAFNDLLLFGIYGGLVCGQPADVPSLPIGKPITEWIPTVAQPLEPNGSEPDEQDSPNDALEAYLRLYEFDYSKVPSGLYPIIPYDLSSEADGTLKLFNDTSIEVDINAYANAKQTAEAEAAIEEPTVLVIHTHGTEAYSEEGVLGYSENFNIPRSCDVTKNVIHIGSIIAKVLNENGVCTVQCDVMHDAESYMGAYERSSETVRSYLERYPTIKYVFDVHRDSVLLADKTKTRPITVANGEVAAQIMTVVGSNELGSYHPNWETNLTLAAKLQTELNESNLGLARAICLRGSAYNQELAPYSLLFEIGSCGNSLKEAEVSAKILAKELAELIKRGW